MKIIESDRLFLREFLPDDVERMSEIYSDEDVMKYIGRGGAADKAQTELMINAFIRSYDLNSFGIWGIVRKNSDALIGHCGFNILPNSEIEIAYLLAKQYWRKGYATEISKATLEYGFDKLKLKKIVALAYPQNISSANVIKKLGMKPDGVKEFFGKIFLYFSISK